MYFKLVRVRQIVSIYRTYHCYIPNSEHMLMYLYDFEIKCTRLAKKHTIRHDSILYVTCVESLPFCDNSNVLIGACQLDVVLVLGWL